MILVTGATGHFGKAAIHFLLKKTSPSNVGVVVRDISKAADLAKLGIEIRQGDYDDPASLEKAFQGADKLLFVSGSDMAKRMKQHENVVRAATAAKVGHVAYTSISRKNDTESSPIAVVTQSHLLAENLLKASGMKYTILLNTLYTDMLPIFMGQQVISSGTIFFPAGSGRVTFATRTDMAEAAAKVLTETGHENKTYPIASNQSYSFEDIAATLSKVSGKKITYVSPEPEVYKAELAKAGVPAEYIGVFAAFSDAIKQGEFDKTDGTLEKLLGRTPATPSDFLSTVYTNA